MAVTDATEKKPTEAVEQNPLVDLVMSRYAEAASWKSSCNVMGASINTWIGRMHRAYHLIHEPSELEQYPNMEAYFGLIHLKVNATWAWGKNQFINQKFAPFVLAPTPDADLPEHLEAQAKARFKQELVRRLTDSGATPEMLIDPTMRVIRTDILPQLTDLMRVEKERARQINYEIASRACKRHTRIIKDQLIEGSWHTAYSAMLFDQALYPFGCMAVERGDTIKWSWSGSRIVRKREEGWTFRHVPVDRAFHAPDCLTAQDGSYFIEQVDRSMADLYQMRSAPNAMPDEIDALLSDIANAGISSSGWMSDNTEVNTLAASVSQPRSGTITTIRMVGEILGSDLAGASGLSVSDHEVVSVTIEVCNGHLLWFDARPYIDAQRPYVSASYVASNDGPAGPSIGMMLHYRQRRLNRLDLYTQASEAMAHGPVIEQMQAAFANNDQFSFAPWSHVMSGGLATGERGLKFHQATPLWSQLYSQLYAHLQLADHECGIPAFAAYGASAGPQIPTLGQTIVHHQAAAKGIQSWLENNDDRVISPVIQVMYHDNLVYLKDPSIEADARVHAQGALGAMARELQAAQIGQAMPQIIQGAQLPDGQGGTLVPTDVAKRAMATFLGQLGLPVDPGSNDPTTDYQPEPYSTGAPGITTQSPDGRSGTMTGI